MLPHVNVIHDKPTCNPNTEIAIAARTNTRPIGNLVLLNGGLMDIQLFIRDMGVTEFTELYQSVGNAEPL